MNKNKGFTLIELIIVIAIIGIIAAAVLSAINPFENQKISRDTIRVSQLTAIAQALELYFSENKSYPRALTSDDTSNNINTLLGKYNSKLNLIDPSGCEIKYIYNSTTNTYSLYSISEATKFNLPKGQSSISLLPSTSLSNEELTAISCTGFTSINNYLLIKSQ